MTSLALRMKWQAGKAAATSFVRPEYVIEASAVDCANGSKQHLNPSLRQPPSS